MIERLTYSDLAYALSIERGATAIIGSGGKSTLMEVLSKQLCHGSQRVILTTSTHIQPVADIPLYTGDDPHEVERVLANEPRIYCGTPVEDGKLAAPALDFTQLSDLSDYVLVEADGSRGLPLKAHGPHEPVIPAETNLVVLVIGTQALGQPVADVVHRSERFCALANCTGCDAAMPERVACVIQREYETGALHIPAKSRLAVVLTHAAAGQQLRAAERFAVAWGEPVFALDHPTASLSRIMPQSNRKQEY